MPEFALILFGLIDEFNILLIYDLNRLLWLSLNIPPSLKLNKKNEDVLVSPERKNVKYTPLSKRKDRPDSVLWLVKNFSQLSDGQVAKLVGSTKGTVSLIRKRTYWNLSGLTAKDPVILGLCSQIQFEKAVEKADRRVVREKKLKEKEAKAEKTKVEETKVEESKAEET